jgi:hypothetical protein
MKLRFLKGEVQLDETVTSVAAPSSSILRSVKPLWDWIVALAYGAGLILIFVVLQMIPHCGVQSGPHCQPGPIGPRGAEVCD